MAQEKMLKFLVEGLTRAFDKQEDCDVMFSVDGQTIGAHRLILNVHSQVLYEMAAGWTPDKDPIAINDMSFDSFKALLRFMYGGEIPLSNTTVFIFLSTSTRLKMNFLEELCVDHITDSMSSSYVCAYMEEALNFNSAVLQKKCCEMFSKQTSLVSGGKNFMMLSQPALSALLDVDETNMVEARLFHGIRQWMEQQCRNQGLAVNGTNMRHVIGDALYKIRFPTMTVQDFANSVATVKGLLTDTELAQVYQKITIFENEDFDCVFPTKFRCKVSNSLFPFWAMNNFLKKDILPKSWLRPSYEDCNSALKLAKDQPDGMQLFIPLHSLRFVSQCCADLANSSGLSYNFSPQNQATRNEVYDEFLAWQDIVETGNVSDIMEKYSELRVKLSKLYNWSI